MDFTPYLYLCIFSICLLSHKSSCSDPKYEACVPKSCGNFTISFPFYIQDQQESFCGYPGFNLTCNNNEFPTLQITDDEYVVDEIFYGNRSLRLSNAGVWRSNSSCSLPQIRNITLQDTSFELISNNSYLVIFSNCSSSLSEGLSGYKVDCEVRNSQRRDGLVLAMYGNDKGLSSGIEACEVEVVAPVDQVYVESSTGNSNGIVDYVQLLRRGFLLSWTSSDCSQCEESGGKCGFEAETYRFKCYCPDRGCPTSTGLTRDGNRECDVFFPSWNQLWDW